MELNWSESHLIVVLRVLVPFFRKHGFSISNLEYDFRDGDYIEFKDGSGKREFVVIYNPGFDFRMRRKRFFMTEDVSLLDMKNKTQEYSNLPEDYNGEEELHDLLKGYTEFIESRIL